MRHPAFLDGAPIPLGTPAFDAMYRLAGSFHDAALDSVRREGDLTVLRIEDIYFSPLRAYDPFGSYACEIHLGTDDVGFRQLATLNDDPPEILLLEFLIDQNLTRLCASTYAHAGKDVLMVRTDFSQAFARWVLRD